jgi:hypothetical protein
MATGKTRGKQPHASLCVLEGRGECAYAFFFWRGGRGLYPQSVLRPFRFFLRNGESALAAEARAEKPEAAASPPSRCLGGKRFV